MVMMRTTTTLPTLPRNDLTKNGQPTVVTNMAATTTTRDNILITKLENIFNKYLKYK